MTKTELSFSVTLCQKTYRTGVMVEWGPSEMGPPCPHFTGRMGWPILPVGWCPLRENGGESGPYYHIAQLEYIGPPCYWLDAWAPQEGNTSEF